MPGKNVMLEVLGRYSRTNLVLLLLDEMVAAAEHVWNFAERTNRIEFYADKVSMTEIVTHAQGEFYDGILLRVVERLSHEQQGHLERLLIKMQPHERGKFILTSNDFNSLHPELKKTVCKINFTFSIKTNGDDPKELVVEKKKKSMKISQSGNNVSLRKKSEAGFSLIEMIVVVVIIGVIAAIAFGRFQEAVKAANEASAVSGLTLIHKAQTSYRSNHATYGSMDDLKESGFLDEAFDDTDGNPNTGDRSGFLFQITFTAGDGIVISAIPQSTGIAGSGRRRIGADASGTIYRDDNNLTTHYTTEAELRSGTSVPYNSN